MSYFYYLVYINILILKINIVISIYIMMEYNNIYHNNWITNETMFIFFYFDYFIGLIFRCAIMMNDADATAKLLKIYEDNDKKKILSVIITLCRGVIYSNVNKGQLEICFIIVRYLCDGFRSLLSGNKSNLCRDVAFDSYNSYVCLAIWGE